MDDVRNLFQSKVTAEAGKDGLIHVSVQDTDPDRASEVANALIAGLYRMTSTLAISEAGQRRLFFDNQVRSEKAALAAAEDDFRQTQLKTGVIQLSGQAEQIIRNVANLRAQIVSLTVELHAMSTYATEQNPDVGRLQERIAALQQELNSAESDERPQSGNVQLPVKQLPEAGLEYSRKLREVTYHTTLLTLLTQEEEGARIDEAKSAPTIQIVDRAVPPDRKSGPHRALIILGFAVVGFCVACFWVFLIETITRKRDNPQLAAKLDEFRTVFHRTR